MLRKRNTGRATSSTMVGADKRAVPFMSRSNRGEVHGAAALPRRRPQRSEATAARGTSQSPTNTMLNLKKEALERKLDNVLKIS